LADERNGQLRVPANQPLQAIGGDHVEGHALNRKGGNRVWGIPEEGHFS
jgi:hypothetical protein